ncbi:MAG: hypothetical protein IJ848_01800 [Alphaproteobacteria bacterium]|nr:hypothetical protein [Alphaproteobacteria bacterium]
MEDITDELLLEIINKINDNLVLTKNVLKEMETSLTKLITHKCLNYLLLLEKLLDSNKLYNEVINYELIINNDKESIVKYKQSVKESILYHLEDVMDNLLDGIKYNYDFYHEIFSNLQYVQTRKYIFTMLIFTMNEQEFYPESKEYNYDSPMLYWNCFKFIFCELTKSEEFLTLFFKAMYEIKDYSKHLQLLEELLKNFEILDELYFEPEVNKPSIKQKILSITQEEIQKYKNSGK